MPGATPRVRIGGIPLDTHGPYAITQLIDRREGPYSAEFTVSWPKRRRPPEIVGKAPVEVTVAGRVRWTGWVDEINWDEGTISAIGIGRAPEFALALDGAGEISHNPHTAAAAAIDRGKLPGWSDLTALPDADQLTPEPDDTVGYLSALLALTENLAAQIIRVDASGCVHLDPIDPTSGEPDWLILPQAGVLGTTEEGLAGTLAGRWNDTDGNYSTTFVGDGLPEEPVDMTGLGPIDATTATNWLNGTLAKLAPLTGWNNGITITRYQITNLGGLHPHPAMPIAGQVARILGQVTATGMPTLLDVTIGESVWAPGGYGGGTLTLNPVNLAPRDLASVIEAAGGQAA